MRNYVLLNWEYLFGDYQAKLSEKAKIYYVKLMFFANNGFVGDPKQVLDSLGYDIGILNELIITGEVLTIPGRDEIFITSYFVHTKFNPMSWLSNPYAIYWKGKLWVKKNGIATLKEQPKEKDPMDQIKQPKESEERNGLDWDAMLDSLDTPK